MGSGPSYYSQGLRARFNIDAYRVQQARAEANKPYADISYTVDEKKYRDRAAARVRAGGLPPSVPAGWPTELQGPLVWSVDDFEKEEEYVYNLTEADKTEILEALAIFKCE